MTPERLREIERLFHEARERTPAERDAFLARACAHDSALRREVESLLAQPPAGLIDAPVGALVAELVMPRPPAAHSRLVARSLSHRAAARRRRHGRGLSRARHARSVAMSRSRSSRGTSRRIRNGWHASSGKHECSPPSITRTSAPSTDSKTPTASGRWCSSWWRARRWHKRSISARAACRSPRPCASRARSPKRSTPRTRRGSSTGISNRRTSRSRRTAS